MANNNDKFISRENAKTLWGYMIDLLTGKQNKLTFDDTPTQSSDNPVKSGGIFTALAGKGTYSKPQNGIPKTDLENAVQTSLGLADSALQSETDPTVPSWAKATNKPSYTQDEVGDGTTYKRVNQTEKDTWNVKQDAISDLQTIRDGAAAGATAVQPATLNGYAQKSSLVEVYNQNGETYNLLNLAETDDAGMAGRNLVCAISDGKIYIKGTKTDSDSYKDIALLRNLQANTTYVARIDVTGTGETQLAVYGYKNNSYTLLLSTSGSQTFNTSDYTNFLIRIRLIGSINDSYDVMCAPFIQTGASSDIGFSQIEPYSLPNTTITPELVRLVDGGAKNLVDLADTTISSEGYIFERKPINSLPKGIYILSYSSTQSSSGNLQVILYDASNNQVANKTITSTSGNKFIKLFVEGTATKITVYSVRAGTYSKFMLCNEEAWNVSQKYVQYRPNYDLVERKPYAITVNSAAILDDLPEGTTTFNAAVEIAGISAGAWMICRTYDLNSAGTRRMQIIEANNGARKFRYYSGSWSAWS